MSKIYKTVRGKTLDIDKLKLANESTIAVGNMKVNARGDALGAGGSVVAGRNQIMDRVYAVEDAPYSPNDPSIYKERQTLIEAKNAQDLINLTNNLTVPISPTEADTESSLPQARGSLASSIAKTATVVQEPLPKPTALKKSSGPSRI